MLGEHDQDCPGVTSRCLLPQPRRDIASQIIRKTSSVPSLRPVHHLHRDVSRRRISSEDDGHAVEEQDAALSQGGPRDAAVRSIRIVFYNGIARFV